MKTLPIIAFLTAFVAFLFSSLSFELSASLLAASGVIAILIGDYSRQPFVRASSISIASAMTEELKPAETSRFRLAA